MVVQNEKVEKACCFYVSEFHLEMILIPYINQIIEEDINILTEKNLRKSIEIVLSKINIKEENKKKILQLKWEGEELRENSNIIIIGSRNFIAEKNEKIKNKEPVSVLDCYSFEEEKDNIEEIIKQYKNRLNTLGKTMF